MRGWVFLLPLQDAKTLGKAEPWVRLNSFGICFFKALCTFVQEICILP